MTKRYYIFLIFALGAFAAGMPLATAAGIEFNVRHSHFASWNTFSTENHVDFDGDGRPEIIFTDLNASGKAIEVFGQDAQDTWLRKQAFFTGPMGYGSRPLTWTDGGESYLGIASERGLAILAGWPLEYQRTLHLEGHERPGTSALNIADIDGDGNAEIVARSKRSLSVHSIDDGRLLWSITRADWWHGERPLLAQLDNDPALEIVVPTASGLNVIDGAIRSIDEYDVDVRRSDLMLAGRFFPDAQGLLHAGQYWTLFRAEPWRVEWTENSEWWPEVSIGDLDGDGIDEIIYLITQFGIIEIMDVQSRQVRRISTPYTAALTVADVDGDGRVELISREWRGYDMVTLIRDGITFEAISTAPYDVTGYLFTTPYVDKAPGQKTDIYRYSYRPDIYVQRVNTFNAEVIWSSSAPENWDFLASHVAALTPIERGIGDNAELMLSVSNRYGDNQLNFYDGTDGAHVRSLMLEGESPSTELRDSLVLNDEEGRASSIITCTDAPQLKEYSYADGALLWTSVGNGASCGRIWKTRSGDIVIEGRSGLVAFDANTRQRTWSIDLPPYSRKIWLIEPSDEPEQFLTLNSDGLLTSYDAATQKHIRTIVPPTKPDDEFYGEILAIPGRSIRQLLVYSRGVLHVMDGTTGESSARIENIGAGVRERYALAITSSSDDSYLVSAISGGSYWTLDLHFPPDNIFSSSFESLH